MTNEDRVVLYKKRKIYKYLTIFFGLLVIILELLALFQVISFIWGVIPFILNIIAKYLYDKIDITNK